MHTRPIKVLHTMHTMNCLECSTTHTIIYMVCTYTMNMGANMMVCMVLHTMNCLVFSTMLIMICMVCAYTRQFMLCMVLQGKVCRSQQFTAFTWLP